MIEANLEASIKHKKNGIFFINKEFDDLLLEYIFLDLLYALNNKSINKITIYINSDGGEIKGMFPIVDLISGSKKIVETIVLGRAYSAAAVLLLSGTKGHRCAYRNSEILLHELSSNFGNDKVGQYVEYVKSLEEVNKRMIDVIKKNTKMPSKQIREFFSSRDIYITSERALELGIIDKIL